MKRSNPELVVSTSPFVRQKLTTARVMGEVLLAALVVLGGAVYVFGFGALTAVAAATVGAVLTELAFTTKSGGLRNATIGVAGWLMLVSFVGLAVGRAIIIAGHMSELLPLTELILRVDSSSVPITVPDATFQTVLTLAQGTFLEISAEMAQLHKVLGMVGLLSAIGFAAAAVMLVRKREPGNPICDNSAILTGVLLGLTLPPTFPLWMAMLGGVAGVGLGKLIFGGLGQNVFNPALVGRAFLQASFPTAITTWMDPVPTGEMISVPASQLGAPLMHVDAVSSATPLGLAKFESVMTEDGLLFLGDIGGSLGETNAALLIGCLIFLWVRRHIEWRLPVSTILTVFAFTGILNVTGATDISPLFMVLSGGLLFGAVFMVTDPVTTPTTAKGAWIFGIGVGVLVVVIRLWGGLPEGVMYAILLMNAATPHINRYTQPRPFGG